MEQLAMSFDEPERWLPIAGYEGMYEVSDLWLRPQPSAISCRRQGA